VIGLAVAAALPGRRPRLTRCPLAALWPAVPGAAIAAAGLLPGLAEESVPRPLVAVAALAAGLGFAALTPHRAAAVPTPDHAAAGRAAATRRRVLVGVAVVAALLAAVPLAAGQQAGPVGALVASRLSAESPERADLRRVTAEQFATAPLTGVGPGRLDLVYVDYLGRLVAAEYTHDEFLQTAAETGLVGAGLAVVVFACLGAAAFRRRHTAGSPFAAAILAAFAAHSTFDFLWHIPVLPLLVTAAVVPLLDRPSHHEEEVTR